MKTTIIINIILYNSNIHVSGRQNDLMFFSASPTKASTLYVVYMVYSGW